MGGCRRGEVVAGAGLRGEGGVDVVALRAVEEGGDAGEGAEGVEEGRWGEDGGLGGFGEELGVGYYRGAVGGLLVLGLGLSLLVLGLVLWFLGGLGVLLVEGGTGGRRRGGNEPRGVVGAPVPVAARSHRLLGPLSVGTRPSSPAGSPGRTHPRGSASRPRGATRRRKAAARRCWKPAMRRRRCLPRSPVMRRRQWRRRQRPAAAALGSSRLHSTLCMWWCDPGVEVTSCGGEVLTGRGRGPSYRELWRMCLGFGGWDRAGRPAVTVEVPHPCTPPHGAHPPRTSIAPDPCNAAGYTPKRTSNATPVSPNATHPKRNGTSNSSSKAFIRHPERRDNPIDCRFSWLRSTPVSYKSKPLPPVPDPLVLPVCHLILLSLHHNRPFRQHHGVLPSRLRGRISSLGLALPPRLLICCPSHAMIPRQS